MHPGRADGPARPATPRLGPGVAQRREPVAAAGRGDKFGRPAAGEVRHETLAAAVRMVKIVSVGPGPVSYSEDRTLRRRLTDDPDRTDPRRPPPVPGRGRRPGQGPDRRPTA